MAGGVPSEEEIMVQVEGLVFDSLSVVSYKWLSRNFSLSSNAAKRLLQKFAKNNENSDLQIVYAISGWSKEEPQAYTIQLVPKPKLAEVKAALKDPPSIHVYSVQRSLPKDPAQLWSPDFVQAEQLFNESAESTNCLRDNRFSAVTCELVHRSSTRLNSSVTSPPPPRLPVPSESAKTPLPSNVPTPKAQVPSTPVAALPPKKPDSTPKDGSGGKKPTKPSIPPKTPHSESKDSSGPVVIGKRKTPAVTVGAFGVANSLASMWGKAPTKPKADSPEIVAASNKASNPPRTAALAGDAEARIQALEAEDGSEDDMVSEFTSLRRGKVVNGGRRRMIVDDGDDDDDGGAEDDDSETIIRISTPESPEKEKGSHLGTSGNHVAKKEGSSKVQERGPSPDRKVPKIQGKPGTQEANLGLDVDSKMKVKRESSPDTEIHPAPSVPDPARVVSKRKKVLKTRIDERGREVTEVVWETEGAEKENVEKDKHPAAKQSGSSFKENDIKPPPAVKPQAVQKPSVAPTKSAANKSSTKTSAKSAGKPGKGQGNIMSFFKKT
ncbi:unnamed protein product [Calypogeia fissa]